MIRHRTAVAGVRYEHSLTRPDWTPDEKELDWDTRAWKWADVWDDASELDDALMGAGDLRPGS